ncbi:hypothetical protein SAMN03159343_3940 [Klenkia marina]|uniref:PQQ-like domain-containing protein n=1 Tax=Klenkia marina TaxID=1960309 RepID=A0A1G4Z1C5_9ACTN|nr:hypothetical protein [Klenkia marina]SCX59497.1 hypothetical protein SAMN03159343_3940 [Klenkia marina]
MHAVRLLVPATVLAVAVLAVARCTSFTDAAPDPSATAGSSAPSGPSSAGGELAVADEVDLGVAATDVAAARVTAEGAVLLVGPTSTVVDGERSTRLSGLAPTDLVLVDGEPVAVGLAADPVTGDPVLALTGRDGAPQPLEPPRPAPRGVPVLAVADGDVVHVLAEAADDLAATVLTVDPASGEVQSDVDLDLGDDVTSIDLVGLAATDDGLLAGLVVRTADGTSAGRLVGLDDDLRQTGDPEVLDGPLLALTADGTPVTADDLGGEADGARVSGAAATDDGLVVALLDQRSPTVLVPVGGRPTRLQLCAGEGDALAVAADDGTVVVAGTCDGSAVRWVLG